MFFVLFFFFCFLLPPHAHCSLGDSGHAHAFNVPYTAQSVICVCFLFVLPLCLLLYPTCCFLFASALLGIFFLNVPCLVLVVFVSWPFTCSCSLLPLYCIYIRILLVLSLVSNATFLLTYVFLIDSYDYFG